MPRAVLASLLVGFYATALGIPGRGADVLDRSSDAAQTLAEEARGAVIRGFQEALK